MILKLRLIKMKKKLNPGLSDLTLTFVSAICIVFLGIYILLLATDFGRSFTTEGYRRHQIDVRPEQVPNLDTVTGSLLALR